MSKPVQMFAWHFMSYPYLPDDFDEAYDTGWITVPNRLWDADRSKGLLNEYVDQLAYADTLGYDGVVLNEHHQNIYGLMPSPNLLAAALTQKTKHGKIVVLGNLLPLHGNPLRVAEEYAMLDNMSDGRIIAGLAPGGGQETFNYNTPAAAQKEQFWEAVELIHQAWTREGPFHFEGKHYPLRYVNPWPQPTQTPHPPIWIPGARSAQTMHEVAKRGYCYFMSSRVAGGEIAKVRQQFQGVLEQYGKTYDPFKLGILLSVHVGDTDTQAREEAREGVWYFLKNCLKGHLRNDKGRMLTMGAGIPNMAPDEYRKILEFTKAGGALLGDAETWDDLKSSQSIIVGSPDTVAETLIDLVETAQAGNFLIQFHMGNMDNQLARKSTRLFAEEVMPRLRAHSSKFFGEHYPALEREMA